MWGRIVLVFVVLFAVPVAGRTTAGLSETHAVAADSDLPISGDPEASITDTGEAGGSDPAGSTCSYLAPLNGPDTAPSSPTIVPVLAVPSDVTPDAALDRVKVCSNGSHVQPALSRAALNIAVWQRKQGANLHYVTRRHTYTNPYTNATFDMREVRRFKSSHPMSWWNDKAILDSSGNSPRLAALKNEMEANGWDVKNTHYAIVLISKGQPTTSTCTATKCPQHIGVANIGGKYDFTVRYYAGSGTKLRYGCATQTDAFVAHEQTHESGAHHVSKAGDLMHDPINRGFVSSTPIAWNSDPDQKYAKTVLNSGYAVTGDAGETGYKTC